ncbi:MAG TPA: hypothetical protein ENK44_04550 [Caldithrix abyssi]|uniref:Uncharacterized protein n=1 Tax=Caldithrix abyssi TaxID=187145 RepID=A0A7V4WUZ5_CALAY|nr:hypothetical protein [Caldithrix abyssi]
MIADFKLFGIVKMRVNKQNNLTKSHEESEMIKGQFKLFCGIRRVQSFFSDFSTYCKNRNLARNSVKEILRYIRQFDHFSDSNLSASGCPT